MKKKSLLMQLCNRIMLIIALGFFLKQLIMRSVVENGFSVCQLKEIRQARAQRKENPLEAAKKDSKKQEKFDAQIEMQEHRLMSLLEKEDILTRLDELDIIVGKLEAIRNDAQENQVDLLINDKIDDLEKKINICKQEAGSPRSKRHVPKK